MVEMKHVKSNITPKSFIPLLWWEQWRQSTNFYGLILDCLIVWMMHGIFRHSIYTVTSSEKTWYRERRPLSDVKKYLSVQNERKVISNFVTRIRFPSSFLASKTIYLCVTIWKKSHFIYCFSGANIQSLPLVS